MFTRRHNRHIHSLVSFGLALVFGFWLVNTLRAAPNGDYALDFDGVSDWVELGRAIDLIGTDWRMTKTVSLWMRPTTSAPVVGNFIEGAAVFGDFPRWFGIYWANQDGNDKIWVFNEDGYTPGAVVSFAHDPGEWVHITLVHANTQLNVYRNGELMGSVATGPTAQVIADQAPTQVNTFRLRIGGSIQIGANPWHTLFTGQVDDVGIWDGARTQDQVRQSIYSHLSGSESGLVAYYRMSNGSGTVLTDNSVNGNDGTLQDGRTGTNTPAPPDGDTAVWVASGAFTGPRMALDFDGVDDYVDVGSDAVTVIGSGWAGTKSVEVWLRPSATGILTDTAVQGNLIFGGAQWGISQATIGGEDRLWLWNNDGDEDRIGLPYTPGAWTHVALVHSGGILTAYQDGRAAGSIASGNTAADSLLTVGGNTSGNHFQGQLDELRLWDTTRTASQILANAYQTVAPDESGLAAYYRFDQENEVGQTEVVDSTGNGHHATMTNMSPNADWVLSTAFNTWIGGDDQTWADGGNWSRYTATDTRLGITRYPNSFTATVTTPTTILDAVISPDADLVVDDTLTVTTRLLGPGHVTVNGDLFNLGSMEVATVTVASGALLRVESGGALTVTGLLQNNGTLSQTQPVSGSVASFFDTGAYGGVQIDSNGQNLGETAVSIRGNQNCTSTPNETVRRCFDITPEFTPTIGVSITFAFADDELPLAMDCNTLNVYHWNGSGWDVITPTVRTCSSPLSFITVEDVTDFSPFVLRSPNSPTAVTLHSFSLTTGIDGTKVLPALVFLLTITGAVLWWHFRRRAQNVR